MSFDAMETPCPLCILQSDEARFYLCFLPSVNNIISCGAHSCFTCECASVCVCLCVCVSECVCVSVRVLLLNWTNRVQRLVGDTFFCCVGSILQIGFKMKQ